MATDERSRGATRSIATGQPDNMVAKQLPYCQNALSALRQATLSQSSRLMLSTVLSRLSSEAAHVDAAQATNTTPRTQPRSRGCARPD